MREYSIHLITPMFGGGVEVGETDPTWPIRGTSIRGQLQFWWRATRGASCSTSEELFMRHAEIWGRTEQASPVEVEVSDVQMAAPRPCARYDWNPQARRGQGGWRLNWESPFRNSALSYALFPFQGQQPLPRRDAASEKPPARYIENGSFKLRIRFPESFRHDVETAVWAWVNFGGIGARTRRGCGALSCQELAPTAVEDFQRWFRWGAESESRTVRDWPTLPSTILVNSEQGPPLAVWQTVIELWQRFRQGTGFARNYGQQQQPDRPGRSRYPEPETIRRVTGRRSSQHARLAHIPDDAFPRAELGLPIVFHFQNQGQGEPPDTVLYPANGHDGQKRERMASPIILKPLALANGQAIPLIMRLVAPLLAGVDMRQGDISLSLPSTTAIQDCRLATYLHSPLVGAASGSALDAFLAVARQRGFLEVTR